ncbi:MAG: 50S ribosomal protein L4, partial [Candidatus Paceibacterota bacterium]
MKVKLYDKNSKEKGTVELPESIFKVSWNADLVHKVLVAYQANRRNKIAHAKDRSEVRGGGKKPWRQKGTGRARHGSIRSPLWRGGGATFGPRNEKVLKKKVNKKIKKKAIFSLLSKKLSDNEIKILDNLSLENYKTKEVQNILNNFLDKNDQSVLFVPASDNKDFYLASRNINNVNAIRPDSLNIYEPLSYKYLFIEEGAIKEIENNFIK